VISVGGTAGPSALAVLRLMARSNLTGCSIGRSLAFAPLKILAILALQHVPSVCLAVPHSPLLGPQPSQSSSHLQTIVVLESIGDTYPEWPSRSGLALRNEFNWTTVREI
jgi:hypothetical protein